MAGTQSFVIHQGKTFSQILRWESPPLVYRPITGILASAPIRITCPAHGAPQGWRASVESVKGMKEANTKDFKKVTVIDADTLEINDVNAMDFAPYASGGVLKYNSPVDLTGFTASLTIKDRVGGATLLSLTTQNGGIVIDPVEGTILLTVTATATDAITWKKAVYDLEMTSATGFVTGLLSGIISVVFEAGS